MQTDILRVDLLKFVFIFIQIISIFLFIDQIKIKLISPTKKKKNAKNKVQRQTKANKKVDVVLMDCKVLLESNMLADVPAQIQTELIESTNKNSMI